MFIRFRHIIIIAILLISTLRAEAQMAMPDYVCVGATKHYNVNPVLNSTYTWKIDGVEPSPITTANAIDLTWNTTGKFILSVQEHSATGCDGPVQAGEVYVYQITLPDPLSECVENLNTVSYNGSDITSAWSDYYTFKPGGDTHLDLGPENFAVIFPSSCPVEIQWKIDFSPTPDPITHNPVTKLSISGIGQPSTYGSEIQFPGDGVDFNNVVHTITYQIVDCNNHISYTNTQTITIKPRPKFE